MKMQKSGNMTQRGPLCSFLHMSTWPRGVHCVHFCTCPIAPYFLYWKGQFLSR